MYAIKIRPVLDKYLLRLLDPTGSAMIATVKPPEGAYLIVFPEDPSKNKVVSGEVFDAEYASRISAVEPNLVKLNKA